MNIRSETVILLEENIRGKPLDIGLGNVFLDLTPKVQTTKEKNQEMGLHQTQKPFCMAKEINKKKR